MKLPVPVSELESFLPHRGSAIWVDQVLELSADEGLCLVAYSPEAPYAREGGLLEAAYLEWMAQSFGYLSAARSRMQNSEAESNLEQAFLAAVKNYQIHDCPSGLKRGDLFHVRMKATHQVGPVTLVNGTVEFQGKVVATASLKLFAVPKS